MRHVVTHFVRSRPPVVKYNSIPPLVEPTVTVLSALAQAGDPRRERADRAFAAGVAVLGWNLPGLERAPADTVGIVEIDAALEVLAVASPRLKKQILEACAACICVDGTVTVEEGELLRAVSDCLGFPMPPLIEQQQMRSPQ
jgi:hypothetical protein